MRKLAAFCGIGLAAFSVFAKADTVVSANGQAGWNFYSTDSSGNVNTGANFGAIVTGPGTPPLGTGSAELKTATGGGDGSEQLRNANYNGVALSSLTSLSYSTFDVANNGQQFPYLKLYLNVEGNSNGPADDAIYFEPPYQTPAAGDPAAPDQGATAMNTWQTWNALTGAWWDDNGNFNPGTTEGSVQGVGTLSDFLGFNSGEFANAVIVNPDTGIGGVRLAVGFASPGDNFEGYVDNFTIGTAAGTTTYDFDPASTPLPTAALGSLVLLGGVSAYRRRQKLTA